MNSSNLPPQEETKIASASFPYNHPELLTQHRGKDIVVIDDKFLGILGEIDFKAIQKYYRSQGKEPVIVCLPPN